MWENIYNSAGGYFDIPQGLGLFALWCRPPVALSLGQCIVRVKKQSHARHRPARSEHGKTQPAVSPRPACYDLCKVLWDTRTSLILRISSKGTAG